MNTLRFCLACQKTTLVEVLDLGSNPLANSYHNNDENLEEYPLGLNVCTHCWHSQLTHVIHPDLMFKYYTYVSGTSKTAHEFFDSNAASVIGDRSSGKVLDIACNDGTQLDYFKSRGWKTYGVDPAQNLHQISINKGHHVICDYWTREVAKDLPVMDVILAQNVFAHTSQVDEFLDAARDLMNHDTDFYIQTSQRNMILQGEFDTMYHEHISFFTISSMKALLDRHGLALHDVRSVSMHGTSYLFHIKLVSDSNRVDKLIEEERKLGLYNIDIYYKFKQNALESIRLMDKTISTFRSAGYKVIGYGAAAKAMTYLYQLKNRLDYIIDENSLKINKLTPGTNIPIYPLSKLEQEDKEQPLFIIILAWNFASEITATIKRVRPNEIDMLCTRYFPVPILG